MPPEITFHFDFVCYFYPEASQDVFLYPPRFAFFCISLHFFILGHLSLIYATLRDKDFTAYLLTLLSQSPNNHMHILTEIQSRLYVFSLLLG